jgi:AraC-like DNA-binding protein
MTNSFLLSFRTNKLDVEMHKHSAYQIVYTLDNSFTSIIDDVKLEDIHGFIIKPHIKHLCKSSNSILNIINVEPASQIGYYISTLFTVNSDSIVFAENGNGSSNDKTIEPILNKITALRSDLDFNSNIDKRVMTIIKHIKENYQQKLTSETFSNLVFLSPSRLSNLFKQETGSSLSKFILWTRLKQAITLSLNHKDESLTGIAYETGFYDLPQLNKYMYGMFGVSPKALKKNSDLIQVF